MRAKLSWTAALPVLSLTLLAACSSNEQQSNVMLDGAPQAGRATAFLVDGDPAGNYGEAFMDAEGRGFMLVGPSDARPAQALYRIDGGSLQREPDGVGGTVTLVAGSSMTLRTGAVAPVQLAGSYTMVIDGAPVDFSLDGNGKLAPAGTGCQLAGNVNATGGAPGALSMALTVSGCAAAGNYDGYVIKSADYLPGAFRMVAEDDKRVLDGYAVTMR